MSDLEADISISHGNKFPFDASDAWWNSSDEAPKGPIDWAHSAARGVLANLGDRRGIKQGLQVISLDEETRVEIVATLAHIIRLAHLRAHQ